MIILNFSHPLDAVQRRQIETLGGQPIETVRSVPATFDPEASFADQVRALLDGLAIDSAAWQQTPWLVVLPSLNFIAAVLLAELHGRMGHFPSIARTRPVSGSTPTRYEVAELINLQQVREQARSRR